MATSFKLLGVKAMTARIEAMKKAKPIDVVRVVNYHILRTTAKAKGHLRQMVYQKPKRPGATHKRTGNLFRSTKEVLAKLARRIEGAVVSGGPGAPYGIFIHDGTRLIVARPYLKKAALEAENAFLNDMRLIYAKVT